MMTRRVKQIIEENINLIDNNDFKEFFFNVLYEAEFDEEEFIELINVLEASGIDTKKVREEVFINVFENVYTEADDWSRPEYLMLLGSTAATLGIPYSERCDILIKWAEDNPGKIEWHWNIDTHEEFEILCIEDN